MNFLASSGVGGGEVLDDSDREKTAERETQTKSKPVPKAIRFFTMLPPSNEVLRNSWPDFCLA
jgi:hypothetical protein